MSNLIDTPSYQCLIGFLIEKTRNAESNLNIHQLCREFKSRTNCAETVSGINSRIGQYRQEIYKMDQFDMDTKVRMMFALRASVEPRFLEVLKMEADVAVDHRNRMTYYRRYDGGLEMVEISTYANVTSEMKPLPIITTPPLTTEFMQENQKILKYLAEKSQNCHKPISDRHFLLGLGKHLQIKCSLNRYRRLKEKIYTSPGFDKKSKIRMMFLSGAAVSKELFNELQKDALIYLDTQYRIQAYTAFNNSLKLKAEPAKMEDLFQFIAEKTQNVVSPMSVNQLCRDFQSKMCSANKWTTLSHKLVRCRNEIHKIVEYDQETVVKMMYALSASVDQEFLERLRESALVEVDKKQRIIKYVSISGNLNLEGDHTQLTKRKSCYEMREAISDEEDVQYIEEKTRQFNEFKSTVLSEIDKRELDDHYEYSNPKRMKSTESELDEMKTQSQFSCDFYDISHPESSVLDQEPLGNRVNQWLEEAVGEEEEPEDKEQDAQKPSDVGSKMVNIKEVKVEILEPITLDENNDDEGLEMIHIDKIKVEPPEEQKKDPITHRKVLKSLRTIVLTLDLPGLNEIGAKLEAKIQSNQLSEHISTDGISLGFESCLHIVTKNASMKPPPDVESTSLKTVLLLIRSAVINMDTPVLYGFQAKLKGLIGELRDHDKFVPVENVRSSLETAITIFSP